MAIRKPLDSDNAARMRRLERETGNAARQKQRDQLVDPSRLAPNDPAAQQVVVDSRNESMRRSLQSDVSAGDRRRKNPIRKALGLDY